MPNPSFRPTLGACVTVLILLLGHADARAELGGTIPSQADPAVAGASPQTLAQQVTNSVSRFALDNNGVVIDLPAIADGGAASVSGSMIFGLGTQANNTLGGATVVRRISRRATCAPPAPVRPFRGLHHGGRTDDRRA